MSQTATDTAIALCASALAAPSDDGAVPEWIHLLPAGDDGRIATADKRGPYQVADPAAVITQSMQLTGGRLPIDENHATDLAAPRGEPAPARGWIVELQARANGIWGRVEWTKAGRDLVEGRAYRAISPVILHDKAKRVFAVLRASLVNKPNLRGLATLHQEEEMDFQQKLAELLGLGADASEGDIMAALQKVVSKEGDGEESMNSVQPEIVKALNLAEDADVEAVVAAIKAAPKDADVVALQSQLSDVTKQLNTVVSDRTLEKATAFVDGAIKQGRVGVKPQRDRLIAMHQKDPAETEALVNSMPTLNGTTITDATPPADGKVALNAEQRAVAAQLGMTEDEYAEELSADQKETA